MSVFFFSSKCTKYIYNKIVHEFISQTVFLAYPESLRYTYNKFYIRTGTGGNHCEVAQCLSDSS